MSLVGDKIPELKGLSNEEKLKLVGELWDELASHPEALPPRTDHIELLKARLEEFRKDPTDVVAWEDIKARVFRPK